MPHNPNPERPKSTFASLQIILIVASALCAVPPRSTVILCWRAPISDRYNHAVEFNLGPKEFVHKFYPKGHGNGLGTACFEQSNKSDTQTLKLKGLGIPWKRRKLILKYTRKYRLRLWRPPAEPLKSAYLSDFNFS